MDSKSGIGRKFIVIITGVVLIAISGVIWFKKDLPPNPDTKNWPVSFGFGRKATPQEIATLDIDVRPDGKGLPTGYGDAITGKAIYVSKCASCHGVDGTEIIGVKLPGPALVSDPKVKSKTKTIGNYWPYATTLFDYLRRAMPYNAPGSLSNNEVYSLSAYLLSANKIIKPDEVLNAQTLPKIVMPAKKLFIVDDRKGGNEVK